MRTVDLAPSEVVAVLIQGSSDHSAARDTHVFVRKGAAGLTGHPGSSQVTGKRTDTPRPGAAAAPAPCPQADKFLRHIRCCRLPIQGRFQVGALAPPGSGHLGDNAAGSGSWLGMWPRPGDRLEDGMRPALGPRVPCRFWPEAWERRSGHRSRDPHTASPWTAWALGFGLGPVPSLHHLPAT